VTSEAILAFLKFSGPVVGLVSALWSMTQKITYEAADGVKHLTLQGRVLIGIIVVSTLISVLALGLESIIREQQAQKTATQKAADAQREERKEAQARAEAAARDQKAALAHILADSVERERFLKQRFLIIGAAAEQQRRATQISLQIAREANQRLSEAQRTFAEFERINYPLRSVEAQVVLALDFGGTNTARMADIWRRIEALDDISWHSERHSGTADIATLEGDRIGAFDIVQYATRGTLMRLVFVTPQAGFRDSAGSRGDEIRPIDASRRFDGPIAFDLQIHSVRIDRRQHSMTAYFTGKFEPAVEGVIQGGEKLSLSDVNKLIPILTIERNHNDLVARRAPDSLEQISFRLNDVQRFSASPGLRISGKSTYVLAAEPVRK
jgi:hypothetical protein